MTDQSLTGIKIRLHRNSNRRTPIFFSGGGRSRFFFCLVVTLKGSRCDKGTKFLVPLRPLPSLVRLSINFDPKICLQSASLRFRGRLRINDLFNVALTKKIWLHSKLNLDSMELHPPRLLQSIQTSHQWWWPKW